MMAKGRTLKDLTQLPHLFTPQVVEQPFVVQLAEHNSKPAPVVDISDAIIDLMRNYRGWTVGDVARCLAKHPESYLVPTLMNKFAIEGKFEIMQSAGNANTYTLKKERIAATISLAPQKPFVFREEQGVRQTPDPKAVIRLEEGMDVSIWKVMADFKPRTAKDIRQILIEYRFDAKQLDRRIDSLIRSNRWFERTHKPAGTLYLLKKGLTMPAIPNTPLNNERQSELAGIKTNLTVPEEYVTAPEIAEVIALIDQTVQADRATVDHSATMSADDHLNTLIWKAMADHLPYKSEDVAALVQAIRPTQSLKSVANRLSALGIEGWFVIDRVGKTNTWTLKEGIACPDLKIDSLRNRKSTPAAAVPAEPTQTHQEAIEMNKPALVQVTPIAPVAAAPLLDLTVRIKGQEFTLGECRQLVDELRKLGYGTQAQRVKNGLVEQTVTIKGVEFKQDELDTIVKGLVSEGLVTQGATKR